MPDLVNKIKDSLFKTYSILLVTVATVHSKAVVLCCKFNVSC